MATSEPAQAEVTVSTRDGVRLVELAGEHDVTTVARVRAAIQGDDYRENVVLSLERVSFIDSAIVGTVFTSHRALVESGHRLVVHCPTTTAICQLLRLTRLDEVVDVVATLEGAVARAAAA
jgi:anti-anti-sigma factor